jgi:hypothetical protein
MGARRLGEYLRRDGAITERECESALERQRELDSRGEHRLIGELLVEMDVIDVGELQRALDRQWEDDLASEPRRAASP